jgi:hypothetical protein
MHTRPRSITRARRTTSSFSSTTQTLLGTGRQTRAFHSHGLSIHSRYSSLTGKLEFPSHYPSRGQLSSVSGARRLQRSFRGFTVLLLHGPLIMSHNYLLTSLTRQGAQGEFDASSYSTLENEFGSYDEDHSHQANIRKWFTPRI